MAGPYQVNVGGVRGYWTDAPGSRFLASLLSPAKGGSQNVAVGLVELPPRTEPPLHVHAANVEEIWYVISGAGRLQVGDSVCDAKVGDVIYGPGEVPHRLLNPGDAPLKALFILSPPGDELPIEKNTAQRGATQGS